MALPPKGDPQRSLHLAIRSTRLLGIILSALGVLASVSTAFAVRRGLGMSGAFLALGTLVFYLGPGMLYLLSSVFMARRRRWAIIVALVLASIHLTLTGVGFIAICVAMSQARMPGLFLVPLGIDLIFVVAFIQLILHLVRSFESLKHAPVEMQHGFEPIMRE